MRVVHAMIERLNEAGVQVCWARELQTTEDGIRSKPAVWLPRYGLLVLSAAAPASALHHACESLLALVAA